MTSSYASFCKYGLLYSSGTISVTLYRAMCAKRMDMLLSNGTRAYRQVPDRKSKALFSDERQHAEKTQQLHVETSQDGLSNTY